MFRSLSVGLARESKGEGKERESSVYCCALHLRSACQHGGEPPRNAASGPDQSPWTRTCVCTGPTVNSVLIDGSEPRPSGC